MRGIRLLLIGSAVSLLLSGCNVSPVDLNAKKVEVSKYNAMVGNTLDAYAKSRVSAEGQKAELVKFLTTDSQWGSSLKVQKLSVEDSNAFKSGGVAYDKFFTSYGADAVREVLVINGKGKRMFATVIWRKDKAESVNRVVKGL